MVAGVFPPSAGRYEWQVVNLNGVPVHKRVQNGHRSHIPECDAVRQHDGAGKRDGRPPSAQPKRYAASAIRLPSMRREEEQIYLEAMKYLNLVGLGPHAEESAASLPFGQRRLVAIARALATNAALLMLDEPAAGLNALEKMDSWTWCVAFRTWASRYSSWNMT